MTHLAMLAFAASFGFGQPAAVPRRSSVWLVPWDELPASALGPCVQEIDPFVYAFDAKDRPYLAYPGLLQRVVEQRNPQIQVVPVLVNDVLAARDRMKEEKSIELLTRKLNSDKLVRRHVQEVLSAAARPDVDGLEIDYERIPPALYGRFADFVEQLAAELHKRGKILSVDLEAGPLVVAKQADIAKNDWPRIARAADEVKVMMYYERGDFSDAAGPGTSLSWLGANLRKAARYIPPDKLFAAISLSGTDWPAPYSPRDAAGKVERLHYGQVLQLLRKTGASPEWDARWSAPLFRYAASGRQREVWFENERSIAEKVRAAAGTGAGAALWYLGADHPDVSRLGLCRR